MFYLYDVFDLGYGTGQSVGVYALVLICISVACISLFISMKSIHNSMQITYDKEYKVRYLVIVCVVSLFVSQIFTLYIFLYGILWHRDRLYWSNYDAGHVFSFAIIYCIFIYAIDIW